MDSVFKICKKLLIRESFYGLFLLNLNKRFSDKIETAGVTIEGINPLLLINEKWWKEQSEEFQLNILRHEVMHLMFGHLTSNWDYLKHDHRRLNIAEDTEINSYLPYIQENCPDACFPSKWGLEDKKGTLYYYQNLPDPRNNGNGEGELLDDHSIWEELSEAQQQLAQQQIDRIAKQTAEQVKRSQGIIPGEFKDYIDELFKIKPRLFDWKSYFRRYLGTVLDVEIKKSRKKESIRFPDASGIKHKRKSQIFVVVDTSGSISQNDLCDFFSEIYHVYKAGAIIDICEIDTKIQRIYRYTGKLPEGITGRGGTILSPAAEYFNEHRREYTSCVIFTDGYCDVDFKIYGDTMWIIASDGARQSYPGRCLYIDDSRQN